MLREKVPRTEPIWTSGSEAAAMMSFFSPALNEPLGVSIGGRICNGEIDELKVRVVVCEVAITQVVGMLGSWTRIRAVRHKITE